MNFDDVSSPNRFPPANPLPISADHETPLGDCRPVDIDDRRYGAEQHRALFRSAAKLFAQDPAERLAAERESFRQLFDRQRSRAMKRQKRVGQYAMVLPLTLRDTENEGPLGRPDREVGLRQRQCRRSS
jgi:hypothetical protein